MKHWIAMQCIEIILLVTLASCVTCQGIDLGTCVYLVFTLCLTAGTTSGCLKLSNH